MEAYKLWQRVDYYNSHSSLLKLSEITGIKYQRLKEQRSSNRIPSAEDLYKIAKALNLSMEFLLTGEPLSISYSKEALAVERDQELRTLVKLCLADRTLLSLIMHVIEAHNRTIPEAK